MNFFYHRGWSQSEIELISLIYPLFKNEEELNQIFGKKTENVVRKLFKWYETVPFPDNFYPLNISSNYLISKDGEIMVRKTRKLLKPGINGAGYKCVAIDAVTRSIHVLVARQFINNPDNKPQINHIDGNKLNNNYLNLEWVTPKENSQHNIKLGLTTLGSDNHHAKLSEEDVITIRDRLAKGELQKDIAKDFNVTQPTISYIVTKGWSHV